MSKELKPYEKENLILNKIRQKKEHQHRRKIELKAIERGLERLERTYVVEKGAYIEELKARELSIENVENQLLELTRQLKAVLPKPKPKPIVIEKLISNGKIECELCGKMFAKSGIKSHRKACLKKLELQKLQEEINKLEIEETLEELDKEEKAEVIEEVEEIIEDLVDEITEDIIEEEPKIDVPTPKEEGD